MKPFKYHLLTFGCQMNKSDSERIRAILHGINFLETDNEKEADFILMNTCSVRQKAEDRIYGFCHKFQKLRQSHNKNLIIGVTGCMPGRDHDGKLQKNLPMVDLFFDIQRIPEIPQMLSQINHHMGGSNTMEEHYLQIKPRYKNQFQAFIPIQTGCNKFCTYCVVPFSRGLEINRPLKSILDEIHNFAALGGKEITLLGQTVNSYMIDDTQYLSKNNPYKVDFAALLWEINQIEGIRRIHFTAPHPRDMQDEVIDALTLPKHLNFLHLPVQSGSNKILKAMNRPYTREHYINLIHKIKKKIPDIALATDIIVGFCGETKADFQQTMDLYRECQFDISYTAKYSPRSGTLAYKGMQDDVPADIKKHRWNTLQNLMNDIVYQRNQKFQDQIVEVLFDEYDAKKQIAYGWTREMKKIQVKSTFDLTGNILNVKVNVPEVWLFEGEVVDDLKIKIKDLRGLREKKEEIGVGLPML